MRHGILICESGKGAVLSNLDTILESVSDQLGEERPEKSRIEGTIAVRVSWTIDCLGWYEQQATNFHVFQLLETDVTCFLTQVAQAFHTTIELGSIWAISPFCWQSCADSGVAICWPFSKSPLAGSAEHAPMRAFSTDLHASASHWTNVL